MSKELEALKRLADNHRLSYFQNDFSIRKDYELVGKALKDFEWLKSKIDIDFVYRLPTDDRIKLFEILGVKYE